MGTELATKIKAKNIPSSSDLLPNTDGAHSYHGFALKNTGAGTATVTLYDSADASGTILDVINLVVGETASDWYDSGIAIETGHCFVQITGSVSGSFRIR